MKTIYISGIIGFDVTADDIREQVDPKSKEKLQVIINSNGGYVSDGFEIYNILKSYKGELEIIIGVMAASIASYIAMAAPLEKRKAFKNSSFMVHEASRIASGRARELFTFAERLEGVNNIVAGAYSEGLRIEKEKARAMMTEDKYFTGWESLADNSIISDIIDLKDIEIPQKEEQNYIVYESLQNELNNVIDITEHKEKIFSIDEKINSDFKKSQDDLLKATAFLNKEPKQPDKNPAEKNNLEGSMDFKEYLKNNSDAQAEFEKALNEARAEGLKNLDKKINDERLRFVKILKTENIKISESAEAAILENVPLTDYMEKRIQELNEIRSGKKESVFTEVVSNQTPQEQDKTGADEQAKKDEEFNKKLEEYRKKRGRGDK